MDGVSFQVAERSWQRRSEGRRIEEDQSTVLDEWVDAGHQVWTSRGARLSATGRVDDCRASDRRVVPVDAILIAVYDVIARDQLGNWQTAARVENRADGPSSFESS